VIDHVVLNISDYEASKHFYVEALRPLGYNVILEFEPIA
jgi:catechol 2,3-dioxygenase-like lactoylglutathione lyase family enzyme